MPTGILALQAAVGNRTVTRVLEDRHTSPIQRMPSKADTLRKDAIANYKQTRPEFRGNANVQVEARTKNPERLVGLLVPHMEDRGERGRAVKKLLQAMAAHHWCITSGVHQGGLGGAGRNADPNRHLTLDVGGRGYHVQLMANDELQNVTGG